MAILSISIPTYNRVEQLKELVESILFIDTPDIEVVVTNNGCTDGTMAMLRGIDDLRLKVFTNDKPVPGYYNMILGLFNSNGKYVLHCNDRDILCTERLLEFVEFLKNNNYSYISTTRNYLEPTYDLKVYDKGFSSLLNQDYSRHPTGMVFNRYLMNKYLQKETYYKYVNDTFTYCFLLRDLLIYEKSAIYDNRIWNERHSSIKLKLASGSIYKGGLYFEPERICVFMRSVIKHLIGNPYFSLNENQEKTLIISVFKYFKKQLIYKKECFVDNRECAHYGMKQRFISYFEMKKSYLQYLHECDDVLETTPYTDSLNREWSMEKNKIMKYLLKDCLKADYFILVKKYKRLVDSKYPY